MKKKIEIAGGGLAGCEAAYRLASSGRYQVVLYEKRPVVSTPAHQTEYLSELVCSNSLHSDNPLTAPGNLKTEMRRLDSLILKCAEKTRVPAGSALAVNRSDFCRLVSEKMEALPDLTIIRKNISSLSELNFPAVISTGPLSEGSLVDELRQKSGDSALFFFDAIAPAVYGVSIDMEKAFFSSRYEESTDDYLNLPLSKEEYDLFVKELTLAETFPVHEFEKTGFFEGCLPVEVIAKRGPDTLRFGPMRPVGLTHDRSVRAIVQLRKEDIMAHAYNLVGFQTNLLEKEQRRVFGMIPALNHAEFARYGRMHRNTYFNSPLVLDHSLQFKNIPGLYLAGQLTGVEGYCESAMTGIMAALFLDASLCGKTVPEVPSDTAIGALLRHLRTPQKKFSPMNANHALYPDLEGKFRNKTERRQAHSERAALSFEAWMKRSDIS